MFADTSTKIIASGSVRDYFQTTIEEAIDHQGVNASQDTTHYIVDLLVSFTRSDKLFENTPEGKRLTPLALLYFEALHASSVSERNPAPPFTV